MNDSISCLAIWPSETPCSGNGVCQEDGSCECFEGWLGVGDFITESADCDIHVLGLQIEWTLVFICAFSACVRLLSRDVRLVNNWFRGLRQRRVTIIYVLLTVLSINLSICSAMKVYDPSRYFVGGDLGYTIIFCIGMCGFWIAVPVQTYSYFIYASKSLNQVHGEDRARLVRVMKMSLFVFKLVTILGMFSCLVPIVAAVEPEIYVAVLGLHYGGIAVVILGSRIFAVAPLANILLKDLKKNHTSMHSLHVQNSSQEKPDALKKLENVITRLQFLLDETKRQLFINAITIACFMLVEGFRRKTTYQLGFAWGPVFLIVHAAINLQPVVWVKKRIKPKRPNSKAPRTSAIFTRPNVSSSVVPIEANRRASNHLQ